MAAPMAKLALIGGAFHDGHAWNVEIVDYH
jgi:hypothetical protein